MISIGIVGDNSTDAVNVRCDRFSPLGNPYIANNRNDRDKVCDQFDLHFHSNLGHYKELLEPLIELVRSGKQLNLQCHCHPKRCHTETIKRYIEKEV